MEEQIETRGLPPLRGAREIRRWDDYLRTGLVFCQERGEKKKKYLLLAAYTVLSLTVTDHS